MARSNVPGPVSADERAAILDMFAKDAPIAPAERASILAMFEGGPGSGSSTYSGGQAWAADVAARRATAKAGQLDALRASIASSEVSIDTRPGSIYVQRGDSLSKIAARFPEYGSTNDLKNQFIAANPQLADPNMLHEGMVKFPGAGTAVDIAAMARAVGADRRYLAALSPHNQGLNEPVFAGDSTLGDLDVLNAAFDRRETALAALRGFVGPLQPPTTIGEIKASPEMGIVRRLAGVLVGEPAALATKLAGGASYNPITNDLVNLEGADRKLLALLGVAPLPFAKAGQGVQFLERSSVAFGRELTAELALVVKLQ